MVYKLENNVLITPPQNGRLKDGRFVTGYNSLPLTTLKNEGWKVLVRQMPTEEDLMEKHYVRELTETETEIIEKWVEINEI